MNAADPIPLIDLAPLAGGGLPGAHEIAPALRTALEETGFLIITNHGVPQELIDATFAEAKRFHDQSLEAKLAVRMNAMPVRFLANHGRRNAISQSSRMMKHRLRRLSSAWPGNMAAMVIGGSRRCCARKAGA